jgi:hypothetical protein
MPRERTKKFAPRAQTMPINLGSSKKSAISGLRAATKRLAVKPNVIPQTNAAFARSSSPSSFSTISA